MMTLSIALVFQSCGGDTLNSTAPNRDVATTEDVAPDASSSTGDTANSTDDSTDSSMEKIAAEHKGDKPTPTPAAIVEPTVPVIGRSVTYATIDGQPVTGYLAQPESVASDADSVPLPALITIHEWWGLNENIEAMTRRLAGEGYTVLALDLYGDAIATNAQTARDYMRGVMDNPGPAQDNIFQAAEYLKAEFNAPAIGSIGWCFGGAWSLRTGLLLTSDLDALAIYYGQLLLAPEALDALDMPIIGFFGEDDQSIAVDDVENFESILNDLGKKADIHLYPGVGHAFANPSGQNYNADAAEDAWEKTTAFFAEHLKG